MMLREGLELKRTGPGVYKDAEGEAWRLVPVDRAYPGKRGPRWYLQKAQGKKTVYASGVFTTARPDTLSADYLDELGAKHYLDILVAGQGEALVFKARDMAGHGGRASLCSP